MSSQHAVSVRYTVLRVSERANACARTSRCHGSRYRVSMSCAQTMEDAEQHTLMFIINDVMERFQKDSGGGGHGPTRLSEGACCSIQ